MIDQKDAAVITDHGSKLTPWHRVHDSYVNTAHTLALEHYKLVIAEFGSAAQKEELRKLEHDSVEMRWRLLEQLTEDISFGTANPNISNLQHGRAQRNKARVEDDEEEGEEGPQLAGDDDDDGGDAGEEGDDEDEEEESPPPRRTTRKRPPSPTTDETRRTKQRRDACQGGVATTPGICGMVGCKNHGAMSGCMTCGVRLCMWKCMNKHLRGEGKLKCLKVEIEWKQGDWY